ncbi:DUF7134 domain-containing protein [Bifidobacterium oedipodis]|nr:histidine kinase [Bifidobacterium sp. DSM 109957]
MALLVISSADTMTSWSGILFEQSSLSAAIWTLIVMFPLVFRRRWPQAAALAFVVLVLAQLAFGPALIVGDFFALVMVYSVIVYGNPRHTRAFIILTAAMTIIASVAIGFAVDAGPLLSSLPSPAEHICRSATGTFAMTRDCARTVITEIIGVGVAITLCVLSAIVLAFWQRARLYTLQLMREREQALLASEREEQHIAALAERARIARDMHDVVAHTLSTIIIQSDGGRYAGAHDSVVARSTMETIRNESQRALGDMNRLLTVFGWSASAGYGDIDSLVEQSRAAAGDAWTLNRRVVGIPMPQSLSDEASMAAYRLVQEALTNVRKHAGMTAGLHVDIVEHWEDHGVTIQISDDGRGSQANEDGHQPGYGLIGMRERIEAVGGSVASGPRHDARGFEVAAFLPYQSTPVAASHQSEPTASYRHPEQDSSYHYSEQTVPSFSRYPEPTAPSRSAEPATSFPIPIPLPLSAAAHALRSEPIDQPDTIHGARLNWIERLSQWTERHYLAMDVIGTLVSLAFMFALNITSPTLLSTSGAIDDSMTYVWLSEWFVSIGTILPLMFRRRFPDATALVVAGVSAFQLVFLPSVLFINMFALVALYSAVLYERRHTWKRYAIISLIISALFGAKIWSTMVPILDGSTTVSDFSLASAIYQVATGQRALFNSETLYQNWIPVLYTVMLLLCCSATIAGALWSRSRGSNALVLQAREEALRAERAKQRVLAANMERDRISANIQTEVTATLTSVDARAEAGLMMLDEAAERGEEPSSEAIVAAFEAIGRQGREALAHMRQLLRVLRETGFSDEAHLADAEHPGLQLAPAASLDEQFANASSGSSR